MLQDDSFFSTWGTRDPESSRALITSPLYQSWGIVCWKHNKISYSNNEHPLFHKHLTHLLLGDEGEGEPLVPRPPCAADSVHSVQREMTRAHHQCCKTKKTNFFEREKVDRTAIAKSRLPTFLSHLRWNRPGQDLILIWLQIAFWVKFNPLLWTPSKFLENNKNLVGVMSRRLKYLWT